MVGRTAGLVPALLVASAVASLGQSVGGGLHVTIDEWPVPQPKSRPHDPAVAPDGAAWYTGQMNNTLGRWRRPPHGDGAERRPVDRVQRGGQDWESEDIRHKAIGTRREGS